jgi:outer membrane lipoprotein-sorting protein
MSYQKLSGRVFVALAAVVVLTVVAGAIWFFGLRGNGGEDCGDAQFCYYFEARFTLEGPNAVAYGMPTQVVKTWYQAPDHFRQEWYEERDGKLVLTNSTFYDGQTWTEYNETQHTYYVPQGEVTPFEPAPGAGTVYAMMLGPLPGSTPEQYFGQGIWRRTGSDQALGRKVSIIEYEVHPVGPKGESEYGTVAIDEERMFAMRYSITRPIDQGVVALGEVTKLDYDRTFPKETFEFRPPPDAKQVKPGQH